MGKEGDLWDDSALINAFDAAISKYKRMHGRGHQDNSKEGGKIIGGTTEENMSSLVDESCVGKIDVQADDNSTGASHHTNEAGESNDLPQVGESHPIDSYNPCPVVDSSNCQNARDVFQGHSNAAAADDYTQLLSQYYELEEQRQTILQQLQQFGSWNYQGSVSDTQCGAYALPQDCHAPTSQNSYASCFSSCCPYAGQCLVAPCSIGRTCVGKTCDISGVSQNGMPSCCKADEITKTGMDAAQRALALLRTQASDEKGEETSRQLAQSSGSETDLTVVLNAWYSAGLHTGKYLAEQSRAKRK